MDWYLKVLKNYVGFRGRARRKEYWMFILVNIIFTFVLGLLDKMLGWQRAGGEGILTTIYGILVFLPWWAVQFRRLHDTDRSAWWALLFLIPFIGWLIIIVFNCQAGTPGLCSVFGQVLIELPLVNGNAVRIPFDALGVEEILVDLLA